MLISTVLLSRGGRWWRWRGWYGTAAHGRPPHSKLTGLGLIPANTRLKTFITSSAPHAFSSSFNSQSSIPHHHATEEVGKDKTFVTRWLHCNDPRKEMTNVHRALHCIVWPPTRKLLEGVRAANSAAQCHNVFHQLIGWHWFAAGQMLHG